MSQKLGTALLAATALTALSLGGGNGTGGIISAAYAAPAKAEKYLQDGNIRFDRQDYRGALIQFENAVRENPDDMTAMFRLGETLIQVQDFARAERMLEIVQKKSPRPEAQRKLIEAVYYQRRIDDALKLLDPASEDPKDKALFAVVTSDRMLRRSEFLLAIAEAEKAANEQEYASLAKIVQAKAYYGLGEIPAASAALEEAISQQNSFQAILLKARIALRSGDYGRAIAVSRGILAVDAGNVSAGAIVAEAHIKAGDLKAAEKAIGKLKPVNAKDPRPKYLNVLLSLAKGDPKAANLHAAEISEWLRQTPNGPALMARLHFENENYVQTEKVLRDHLLSNPNDMNARALLVHTLMIQKKTENAQNILSESLALNAKDPQLLQLQAQLYTQSGKFNEAAALYNDIVASGSAGSGSAQMTLSMAGLEEASSGAGAIAPDDYAASAMTMMTALTTGKPQAALAAAKNAVEASPNNPLSLNLLAAAYMQNNDETSAREALNKALEIDPGYISGIVNLARLDMRQGKKGALEQRLKEAARNVGDTRFIDLQLIDHYIQTERKSDALAIARTANMTNPGDPDIARRAGILLLEAGQPEQAIEVARRLFANADAVDANVAAIAAEIYLAADRPVWATQALMRVLGRGPEASLEPILVRALIASDRPDDAIERLRLNLQDQPRNLDIREDIATLLASNGRVAEAITVTADIKAIDRNRGILAEAKLRAAQNEEQALLATKMLESAARTSPDGRIMRALFLARKAQGATPEEMAIAIDQLAKWVKANPNDSETALLLGNVYLEENNLKMADQTLTLALAGRPRDPILLNNLAWTRYLVNGPGAASLAQAAYTLNPQDPQILDTYGVILTKNGKYDMAIKLLKEAQALAPSDQAIAKNLAAAEESMDAIKPKEMR